MAKKVKAKIQENRVPGKPVVRVPDQYVFYCRDGRVFADLRELAEGLKNMSDETFTYHSNLQKEDFSRWVRDVVGDERLANDLARANNRLQAAQYVVSRIALPAGE